MKRGEGVDRGFTVTAANVSFLDVLSVLLAPALLLLLVCCVVLCKKKKRYIHVVACCVYVLCFVTTTIFFLEDSSTNSLPPPPAKKNIINPSVFYTSCSLSPEQFTYMRVEEESEDYTLPVETLRWKGVEPSNIFNGKLFVEEGHYTRHF